MENIKERNRLIEAHYRENFNHLVQVWTKRLGGNRHNAEDFVQTGYTNALEYWPEGGPDNFENWINNVIKNAGKKEVLKEHSRLKGHTQLDDIAVNSKSGPAEMEIAARVGEIKKKISQESERAQEVLNLYFFERLTYQEIADSLGYAGWQGPQQMVLRFRQKHGLNNEDSDL